MAPIAALGVATAPGCLPEVPPDWLLEAPRLLLIEQEVIATGELSTPLTDDPPGRRRREGLPGDRVRLRPIFFDADGPFSPEVIVLLSTTVRDGFVGDTPIPPCEGGAAGVGPLCRLADLDLVLPPLPPADAVGVRSFVRVIASEPGGVSAETCLQRARAGEVRYGCLYASFLPRYGPLDRVETLQGEDVDVPPDPPDLDVPSARLELEIVGADGPRSVVAHHGDTVLVTVGERARATLGIDRDELQTYSIPAVDAPIEQTEVPRAIWWSTARALDLDTTVTIRGPAVALAIPDEPAIFDLTLWVEERSGSAQWLWVRFDVRERGGAAVRRRGGTAVRRRRARLARPPRSSSATPRR
ncbi:MAG: hypothetical protein R3B09_09255 [Nannocystaceae bacterium]